MSAILMLTLRALAGRKRLLILGLLMAVPVGIALIFTLSRTTESGSRFAIELFDNVVLPVVLPLTALVVAVSALGNEIEDRTVIYLTLRPVRRSTIVLAKYFASAILVGGLVAPTLVLMYVVAARKTVLQVPGIPAASYDGGSILAALLIAGLGGCLAYCALFLLLGMVMPQRGLLVGLVYVLGWEGLAAGLSTALATLSIRRYVQGLLDTHLRDGEWARLISSSLSAGGSAIGLIVISGGALLLTAWSLRRLQLA